MKQPEDQPPAIPADRPAPLTALSAEPCREREDCHGWGSRPPLCAPYTRLDRAHTHLQTLLMAFLCSSPGLILLGLFLFDQLPPPLFSSLLELLIPQALQVLKNGHLHHWVQDDGNGVTLVNKCTLFTSYKFDDLLCKHAATWGHGMAETHQPHSHACSQHPGPYIHPSTGSRLWVYWRVCLRKRQEVRS